MNDEKDAELKEKEHEKVATGEAALTASDSVATQEGVPAHSHGDLEPSHQLHTGELQDESADDENYVEEPEDDGPVPHVEPLEFIDESLEEDLAKDWYILKVAVNREDSIRESLLRRIKREGLERYFGELIVPTEDVAEFTKTGKRKVVKKKLYPGYLLVNMHVNDESWFIVRETSGIGDFTGSGGKPSPMSTRDVEKILKITRPAVEGTPQVRAAIPFKVNDKVRVKEGFFQNLEGHVEAIDEANGRVKILLFIFGRPTPVDLEHWQVEKT